MKKSLMIVAALGALAGCKSVSVTTPDWSASYFSIFQSNDVKGLKINAGDKVAVEVEQTKSGIDPAAAEALKTAASALAVASRACAACATGGASEAVSAAVGAACPDGSCSE